MIEFQALNAISPFTYEAEAHRQGLIATLLYNQGAAKKSDVKSVGDLFPYLSGEVPEWCEDARVAQAKNLLNSIKCHSNMGSDTYASNAKFICGKIKEEIQMERKLSNPDIYVIDQLEQLIGDMDGGTK